jgi:putative spermidine/putrescine transport system substrate-binding protein
MNNSASRRRFLKSTATGLGAGSVVSSMPFLASRALAAEPLTAKTWGGLWLDAAQAVTDTFDPNVDWFPYKGSAGVLVREQKAAWPKRLVDFTVAWDPNYHRMYNEGWLVSVTERQMPSLADIPEPLLKYRDEVGVYSFPMSFGGFFWGYREDLVDIEIKDIQDLLHPSLKGKICGIPPEMHVGLTTSSLAMGQGGDEYNQEAGWEFMKELAAAGQFGRIAYSDVDIINSINIGETAISFQGTANWNELKKHHPISRLTKVPGSKGMKTFFYSEAFVIFKGPRQDDAIDVVNHFLSWEKNGEYNAAIGQLPANARSPVPDSAADIAFTDEEIREFVVYPDYEYHAKVQEAGIVRWEKEIAPLIRSG